MKSILRSILFCSLLLAACTNSTPVEPVKGVPKKVSSGARTTASDAAGQWKLNFLYSSSSPYDLSTYASFIGCANNDVWLYLDPTGYATITNRGACSGQTWSGLVSDFTSGYFGFETWSTLSGETMNWTINSYAVEEINFGRVYLGGVEKNYQIYFNGDKTAMYWQIDGPNNSYRYMQWYRSTGGPAIP